MTLDSCADKIKKALLPLFFPNPFLYTLFTFFWIGKWELLPVSNLFISLPDTRLKFQYYKDRWGIFLSCSWLFLLSLPGVTGLGENALSKEGAKAGVCRGKKQHMSKKLAVGLAGRGAEFIERQWHKVSTWKKRSVVSHCSLSTCVHMCLKCFRIKQCHLQQHGWTERWSYWVK